MAFVLGEPEEAGRLSFLPENLPRVAKKVLRSRAATGSAGAPPAAVHPARHVPGVSEAEDVASLRMFFGEGASAPQTTLFV